MCPSKGYKGESSQSLLILVIINVVKGEICLGTGLVVGDFQS